MFYRYTIAGGRIPMDFEDAFGGVCFIAGGAPSLLNEDISKLGKPGMNVLAINNTAAAVPCNFWLGCDKPECYSPRIVMDPSIMKFVMISRRDRMIRPDKFHEYKWKDIPNTYFFGTSNKFTINNLLYQHRDFVWWKNSFYIALQIAYRLGFRTVYLVGCGFKLNKDRHYSFNKKLEEDEFNWNTRLYSQTVEKMKELKPHFDKMNFKVISATPDSELNGFYPVETFDQAVENALIGFPKEYNVEQCVHSSVFTKEAKNGGKLS